MVNPYEYWTTISDAELTTDNVNNILGQVKDDIWVVAACTDRILDNIPVQQTLLETGLSRTVTATERCKDAIAFSASSTTSSEEGDEVGNNALVGHFQTAPLDAQLCHFRSLLLRRLDRLNTYTEMQKEARFEEQEDESDDVVEGGAEEDEDADWDDPWAEETAAKGAVEEKKKRITPAQMPFSLSTFLMQDLLWSACRLASLEWFGALRVLMEKHGKNLWPLRLTVLEYIPEHVHPSEYLDVALNFDFAAGCEVGPTSKPWRPEADLSETEAVQHALKESGQTFSETLGIGRLETVETHEDPLSADELSTWYKNRANTIISSTGMVDMALSLIQHGASQGIPGLDELGEELSLFSRLVYDTPQADEVSDDWTLTKWYTMDPPTVVRAYLSHSTPETLPKDITRLVLPYLHVLEAHAERAGTPDPDLPTRLLYDYILTSPLHLAASVFEASKPTLSIPQRIIKNDEDLARVALACLYGSGSLHEWSTMSRIFECLPAWDYPHDEDDDDVADTTIASLGAFVTPTTAHPIVSPTDLMTFFKPLHVASLSRALDILDVHLEAGEIFSRWSVPAPLKWFLQSNDDVKEQRAWANRMARRAGGMHDQLNTVDDWEWLFEDMIKLTRKSDTGVKNAFGLLSEEEVTKILLSGLLSSGKFEIARSMLYSSNKIKLSPSTIEEICITSSNELYDNASSGNYKFGDMKLAYDCLSVPPPSDQLQREKEFIEATSRICSFNVTSRPGLPISPIEIRLTKDRLSLVSRVLSSNSDAYKHTEVILDLCYKLGFRGDQAAEVKTLAMLADTALQAEDFAIAYENTIKMVETVKKLRGSLLGTTITDEKTQEATEVCWIGCFQLGRQPEFEDLNKKLQLLAYALEFCPSDQLHDVLNAWRRLEKEDIAQREEDLIQKKQRFHQGGKSLTSSLHLNSQKHGHGHGINQTTTWNTTNTTLNTAASSLRAKLQHLHMPSPPLLSTPDAAALASRTFRSVTSNFPFSVGTIRSPSQNSNRSFRSGVGSIQGGVSNNGQGHGLLSPGEYEQEQQRFGGRSSRGEVDSDKLGRVFDVEDVSAQASKVLSKGIGWLIGADDE